MPKPARVEELTEPAGDDDSQPEMHEPDADNDNGT
jgi:hypothetical protein